MIRFIVRAIPPYSFHWHVFEQHPADVIALALDGADVNLALSDGTTPAMCAALNNDMSMLILLRALGANFFLKDERGTTVFDYLAGRGASARLVAHPIGDVAQLTTPVCYLAHSTQWEVLAETRAVPFASVRTFLRSGMLGRPPPANKLHMFCNLYHTKSFLKEWRPNNRPEYPLQALAKRRATWSPENHWLFGQEHRRLVYLALLLALRCPLPAEMWHTIIGECDCYSCG